MDWSASTLWWVAAGALVAAELATGTFYLMMLSLGCVAGAVAAHAGLSASLQMAAAAALGSGATLVWHLRRARLPSAAPAASNRDVNLDIGGTVHVDRWTDEGTARVQYRGAAWSVRHAGGTPPAPGEHLIVAVEGTRLSVTPVQKP
jgi:membrane protein implicated in regulation of membrane protease activity